MPACLCVCVCVCLSVCVYERQRHRLFSWPDSPLMPMSRRSRRANYSALRSKPRIVSFGRRLRLLFVDDVVVLCRDWPSSAARCAVLLSPTLTVINCPPTRRDCPLGVSTWPPLVYVLGLLTYCRRLSYDPSLFAQAIISDQLSERFVVSTLLNWFFSTALEQCTSEVNPNDAATIPKRRRTEF